MNAEKLYAYVARTYGLADLYYLPNTVSLAKVWGGTPVLESGFPYEPVIAYFFSGIGWLNSLLFAGGGLFALDSARLEYLIKAANVLFGLGDSVFVYLILRKLQVSERWSLAGSALFLFNPAVWFSTSVWGQTHVVSIFFVLLAFWPDAASDGCVRTSCGHRLAQKVLVGSHPGRAVVDGGPHLPRLDSSDVANQPLAAC
jgi:hypothetical protein